ncbi:hypothetical protein G4D82_14220 [Flavobacterium sp. CYK-4]|uniref:hypothetical protein n=1 Tax=Flavobacterium lotistagni TaxID=2709660 RepID=UPI001408E252|nr:hypothetical protein [Flavobacterium lotistagni]NHM08376.1 hypothetical protein [Flavobacterium lotistagni]
MKTKKANLLTIRNFNAVGFKKSHFLFIIFLLILLCSAPLSAQQRNDSEEIQPITESRTFLSNLRARETSNRAAYSNAQHIEELLSKVQPSVYYLSGSVKTYGEKPVCLFTNVQSLSRINEVSIEGNNLEMARISIETSTDLNATIDLEQFNGFKKLRYIQILSKVPVTEQAINRMVRNNSDKYSVFFKVQKGDSEQ